MYNWKGTIEMRCCASQLNWISIKSGACSFVDSRLSKVQHNLLLVVIPAPQLKQLSLLIRYYLGTVIRVWVHAVCMKFPTSWLQNHSIILTNYVEMAPVVAESIALDLFPFSFFFSSPLSLPIIIIKPSIVIIVALRRLIATGDVFHAYLLIFVLFFSR